MRICLLSSVAEPQQRLGVITVQRRCVIPGHALDASVRDNKRAPDRTARAMRVDAGTEYCRYCGNCKWLWLVWCTIPKSASRGGPVVLSG